MTPCSSSSGNREMAPGRPYVAPTPGATRRADPEPRFTAPTNDAIDAAFSDADRAEERTARVRAVATRVERARRKLGHRIDGLRRQRSEIAGVDALRQEADLLLAYGFGVATDAAFVEAPDPSDAERTLRIPLAPGVPIQKQADARYKKARKLEDAAAVSAQRLAEAEAAEARLAEVGAQLAPAPDLEPEAAAPLLDAAERELAAQGFAPRATTKPAAPPKLRKALQGEAPRQFRSCEGYPVLVGKSPQQNDRLTMRVARGNDVWLHVGGGRAGSHVVLRVPRGKTASLESLLDAATLAIHFSKARAEPRCEVIYTLAKHVRKPKGLPPGRVIPSQTKGLDVRVEPDRLQRLLDSAE